MYSALQNWCAKWSLTPLDDPIQTVTSWLVKVDADGSPAYLKVHKPESDEHETGAYLTWRDGDGAVRALNATRDAVLLEFLSGPPLSDLVRDDRDKEAAQILADVVTTLHTPKPRRPETLQRLEDRFAPLLALDGGSDRDIAALAADLLATTYDPIPLHGDIHHDNILQSDRGWLAIDPKGLIGDRHYDLANTLFNPVHMPDLVRTEGRLGRLATTLAANTGYDRQRILSWALCHARVSAIWLAQDRLDPEPALSMLPLISAAFSET
ncbi:MAG: aminoglycoside phosphotransferase family protein [Alphaproteobacteria bacterium]